MSATELKMQVTVELVPQLNDVQLSPLAVQHLVDKGLLKFCSNTSLLSSGLHCQSSSHPKQYNLVPVQRQVDKAGSGGEIDRSLNVVVFGVPESKDLLVQRH